MKRGGIGRCDTYYDLLESHGRTDRGSGPGSGSGSGGRHIVISTEAKRSGEIIPQNGVGPDHFMLLIQSMENHTNFSFFGKIIRKEYLCLYNFSGRL